MSVPDPQRRAFWLKHLHTWHWVSSAACLIGMLLFAVTGITLNHAADIQATPVVTKLTGQLPDVVRAELVKAAAALQAADTDKDAEADGADGETAGSATGEAATRPTGQAASAEAAGAQPTPGPDAASKAAAPSKPGIPPAFAAWSAEHLSVPLDGREAEWNEGELYVSLPRAGGDAWLTADLETGEVRYELTDRGWVAYLNDLHKGRNTGEAWKWFLDLFAVACVVFTITGLFLLQLHAGHRPTTWPLVGLGLVIPLLLAILFIH